MTPTDFSLQHLIGQASLPVQIVMALLLTISVLSWFYIFRKLFVINAAKRESKKFEETFWSSEDLAGLYRKKRNRSSSSLDRIFCAGMAELERIQGLSRMPLEQSDRMDMIRRAMRTSCERELDHLEAHLAFLASAGSVSPYIGLLGTVWGIMNAFRGLAGVQEATLAMVAPGIAEALIATAIGLFAAIPAVVAYNRFSHEVDRLANRFTRFIEEFSNILQAQLH